MRYITARWVVVGALYLILLPVIMSAQADWQIKQVQEHLKAAGFDPGPIDGILGLRTKAALRQYQAVHGLPATGLLDEATLTLLGVQTETTRGDFQTEVQLNRLARRIAVGYGFQPDMPKGQIVQAWARDVFSEPLVLNYFLRRIHPDEDAGSVAMQLTSDGMPFLPDLYLRRRVEIVLRMLETAPPRECARLSGHPRYGKNDLLSALRNSLPKLTDSEVRAFFEIVREALMVRIRQREAAEYRVSQEEAEETLVVIAQAVPSHLRKQWVSQLLRVESLTNAAYCDATKIMYKAILRLSVPNASRALRFEFAK